MFNLPNLGDLAKTGEDINAKFDEIIRLLTIIANNTTAKVQDHDDGN